MKEPLKKLWEEAFGDDRSYIDFFFANRFHPDTTVVCLDGRIPVGAAYCLSASVLQPASLPLWQSEPYSREKSFPHPDGEGKQPPVLQEMPVRYIYAVAVKKEYQRQGIAAGLLRFAYRYFGEPLILEPADEHLRGYYERLGFQKAFYVKECELPPIRSAALQDQQITSTDEQEKMVGNHFENRPDIGINICSPGTYRQIRDARFRAPGYVQWDEQAVTYALKENEFCGGKAYKITIKDRSEILLLRTAGEKIHILETTLTDRDLYQVLKHLGLAAAKGYLRRNPFVTGESHTSTSDADNPASGCIGLICCKEPAEKTTAGNQSFRGYLNLTLE